MNYILKKDTPIEKEGTKFSWNKEYGCYMADGSKTLQVDEGKEFFIGYTKEEVENNPSWFEKNTTPEKVLKFHPLGDFKEETDFFPYYLALSTNLSEERLSELSKIIELYLNHKMVFVNGKIAVEWDSIDKYHSKYYTDKEISEIKRSAFNAAKTKIEKREKSETGVQFITHNEEMFETFEDYEDALKKLPKEMPSLEEIAYSKEK